jgi:cytochrome P450
MAFDRARRHEMRLLAASRLGFPALLAFGRGAAPIRRLPGLGWVVGDPDTIRQVLTDAEHFTVAGEGIVGHLWAQALGEWAYGLLDGPAHQALRAAGGRLRLPVEGGPAEPGERAAGDRPGLCAGGGPVEPGERGDRPGLCAGGGAVEPGAGAAGERPGLCAGGGAAELVERAAGERLREFSADLADGREVDVADLSRVVVGRVVAALLGLPLDGADATYRGIFAAGVELGALAAGSTGTRLPAGTVTAAQAIIAGMTAGRGRDGFASGPAGTLLGRARELGLAPREATALAALAAVAGTQTTASAMARTVALLHDTAEQHALIADPGQLPAAVREGLRVTAPVLTRAVALPIIVAGRRLRPGQRVLLLAHPADTAPGPFRLAPREGRDPAFGAGRHYCLGAPLGQAELTSLLAAAVEPARPWRVVDRRYGRGALIPAYANLRIALV